MNKSIDDKLLPNLAIIFLCTIFLLATIIFGSIFFIRNITDKKNISYMIEEVNVFAIPLESIVTSNVMGNDFKKKGNINDAIIKIAQDNNINESILYDIFNDIRIYNQMDKQLYSNIKLNYQDKNYFSTHEDNTILIEKIIIYHEMKNNISIPDNAKGQIVTILSNFIYNLSNVLVTNNDFLPIFYNQYLLIITIGIIILSILGIISIEKNINKTLMKISNIWLFTSLFLLLYTFIQKVLIMGLQFLVKNYSYNANIVSSNMFVVMMEFAIALLLLSILIRIISKEKINIPTLLIIKKKNKRKKLGKRKNSNIRRNLKRYIKRIKKARKTIKTKINLLFKKMSIQKRKKY